MAEDAEGLQQSGSSAVAIRGYSASFDDSADTLSWSSEVVGVAEMAGLHLVRGARFYTMGPQREYTDVPGERRGVVAAGTEVTVLGAKLHRWFGRRYVGVRIKSAIAEGYGWIYICKESTPLVAPISARRPRGNPRRSRPIQRNRARILGDMAEDAEGLQQSGSSTEDIRGYSASSDVSADTLPWSSEVVDVADSAGLNLGLGARFRTTRPQREHTDVPGESRGLVAAGTEVTVLGARLHRWHGRRYVEVRIKSAIAEGYGWIYICCESTRFVVPSSVGRPRGKPRRSRPYS